MVVEPVDPTYARTSSKLETVIAVIKDRTIRIVVKTANRISPISLLCRPFVGGSKLFLEGEASF